jgi:hypothetical protein
MLSKVTPLQWLGIVILFNSTLLGGASQLGDLSLSPGVVKAILAVATLGNGFLGGLVTMFGSQSNLLSQAASVTANGQKTTIIAPDSLANALPQTNIVSATDNKVTSR